MLIKHEKKILKRIFQKGVSLLTSALFILTTILTPLQSYAQSALNLPLPGTMVAVSPSFKPAIMAGMTLSSGNPLEFEFIIDTGDDKLEGDLLREEANKLIKYFLAALTTPEEEMWVNLSPYEKDRIIASGLGQTEMGRDMLAQDYLLKQLAASLMYPEDKTGSKFWEKVYAKAFEEYGTTEIPSDTFSKIWIVPSEAGVYVKDKSVFVTKSHLKVMLEEDYLALEANKGSIKHGLGNVKKEDLKALNGVSSEVIREVLIPEIEKDVNEGKNFAVLRQIFNSLILAAWYKKNLRESLLGKVYVDRNKFKGIALEEGNMKEKVYSQYIEAFKKGVYDYVKEDYDPETESLIPRKYFSGGVDAAQLSSVSTEEEPSRDWVLTQGRGKFVGVKAMANLQGADRSMMSREDFYKINAEKGWGFPYTDEALAPVRQRSILSEGPKHRSLIANIGGKIDAKNALDNIRIFSEKLRQTQAYKKGKVVLNLDQSGEYGLHMNVLSSVLVNSLGINAVDKIASVINTGAINCKVKGVFISPVDGRLHIYVYDEGDRVLKLRHDITQEEPKSPIVHIAVATVLSPLEEDREEWVNLAREFASFDFGSLTVRGLDLVEHTNDLLRNARRVRSFSFSGGINAENNLSAPTNLINQNEGESIISIDPNELIRSSSKLIKEQLRAKFGNRLGTILIVMDPGLDTVIVNFFAFKHGAPLIINYSPEATIGDLLPVLTAALAELTLPDEEIRERWKNRKENLLRRLTAYGGKGDQSGLAGEILGEGDPINLGFAEIEMRKGEERFISVPFEALKIEFLGTTEPTPDIRLERIGGMTFINEGNGFFPLPEAKKDVPLGGGKEAPLITVSQDGNIFQIRVIEADVIRIRYGDKKRVDPAMLAKEEAVKFIKILVSGIEGNEDYFLERLSGKTGISIDELKSDSRLNILWNASGLLSELGVLNADKGAFFLTDLFKKTGRNALNQDFAKIRALLSRVLEAVSSYTSTEETSPSGRERQIAALRETIREIVKPAMTLNYNPELFNGEELYIDADATGTAVKEARADDSMVKALIINNPSHSAEINKKAEQAVGALIGGAITAFKAASDKTEQEIHLEEFTRLFMGGYSIDLDNDGLTERYFVPPITPGIIKEHVNGHELIPRFLGALKGLRQRVNGFGRPIVLTFITRTEERISEAFFQREDIKAQLAEAGVKKVRVLATVLGERAAAKKRSQYVKPTQENVFLGDTKEYTEFSAYAGGNSFVNVEELIDGLPEAIKAAEEIFSRGPKTLQRKFEIKPQEFAAISGKWKSLLDAKVYLAQTIMSLYWAIFFADGEAQTEDREALRQFSDKLKSLMKRIQYISPPVFDEVALEIDAFEQITLDRIIDIFKREGIEPDAKDIKISSDGKTALILGGRYLDALPTEVNWGSENLRTIKIHYGKKEIQASQELNGISLADVGFPNDRAMMSVDIVQERIRKILDDFADTIKVSSGGKRGLYEEILAIPLDLSDIKEYRSGIEKLISIFRKKRIVIQSNIPSVQSFARKDKKTYEPILKSLLGESEAIKLAILLLEEVSTDILESQKILDFERKSFKQALSEAKKTLDRVPLKKDLVERITGGHIYNWRTLLNYIEDKIQVLKGKMTDSTSDLRISLRHLENLHASIVNRNTLFNMELRRGYSYDYESNFSEGTFRILFEKTKEGVLFVTPEADESRRVLGLNGSVKYNIVIRMDGTLTLRYVAPFPTKRKTSQEDEEVLWGIIIFNTPDGFRIEKAAPDKSLLAKSETKDDFTKGGIDFNPQIMGLQENGSKIDLNFPGFPAIDAKAIEGVSPVIINITPIPSFILLLGMKEETPENRVSQLN
ncbi:MAG: hypothetical protein HQL27_03175 [Candidatus Omnitrophica bacterium]|nr:hypothetical protein [Candidatus Omnitrophota bacterium]